MKQKKTILTDNSKLVMESLAQSGCDVFIGYPITPANLLYKYATQRFSVVQDAPDEISTLQWMAGYSATGHIPVTATSFPGLALMLESLNMAYMMELPMVAILVQRLGPSTGTATAGAQGDLALLNGMISGGHALPVFCLSNAEDCWEIPNKAAKVAAEFRTPVVILTSKEMMMSLNSFDIGKLKKLSPVERKFYESDEPFVPYKPQKNLVPEFLPLGNDKHRVRITSSTHDTKGILQHSTPEALGNTVRLNEKIVKNAKKYSFYELDEQECDTIIVSYDATSEAAREAVGMIREKGKKVSLLICKTMIPVLDEYLKILNRYKKVVIAEENLTGQFRKILFGTHGKEGVTGVNAIGRMISPNDIAKEVK